jgi:hypothetical protein
MERTRLQNKIKLDAIIVYAHSLGYKLESREVELLTELHLSLFKRLDPVTYGNILKPNFIAMQNRILKDGK